MNTSNSTTKTPGEKPVLMTRQKLAVIAVAKKSLHLSEGEYREILRDTGQVESAKDLDEYGFEAIMFRFSQMGFRSTWNQQNFGYRPGMASPRQVAMIRTLWGKFTKGQGDDKSLGQLLSNKFGISSIRFLDADKARKVGGALKRMTGEPGTTKRTRKARRGSASKTAGVQA
jgi:hypothetical protein